MVRQLKILARELEIPIIVLSQLSREVENRSDKKPTLSDVSGSSSIEEVADVVMFIYREEYYLARTEPTPGDQKYAEWQSKIEQVHNIADIIIAKHRNGPLGNHQIHYDSKYSKFNNLPIQRR